MSFDFELKEMNPDWEIWEDSPYAKWILMWSCSTGEEMVEGPIIEWVNENHTQRWKLHQLYTMSYISFESYDDALLCYLRFCD